jgi:cytochrome c553
METGTAGEGGEVFDSKVGFPGEVHVPNITPYNLKGWTDGELFRTITTGERKDGSAIFPLMPWPYYSKMSREDIYSIIAYIRTLKPIKTSYPKSQLNFPLNIIVHTMPQKASLGQMPSPSDTLKYGAYLCNAAGCIECHSQSDNGKILKGMAFAGGHAYHINGVTIRSANITPDKTTGIGKWKEADFVGMFKSFGDPSKAAGVQKGTFQTIMPWYDYSGMTETDLAAIFEYLKTVKPVKNNVVSFQQPTVHSNIF